MDRFRRKHHWTPPRHGDINSMAEAPLKTIKDDTWIQKCWRGTLCQNGRKTRERTAKNTHIKKLTSCRINFWTYIGIQRDAQHSSDCINYIHTNKIAYNLYIYIYTIIYDLHSAFMFKSSNPKLGHKRSFIPFQSKHPHTSYTFRNMDPVYIYLYIYITYSIYLYIYLLHIHNIYIVYIYTP